MRFCYCGQPVFSTDKITGIGYCKGHSYKRTDTDKRSIIQKAIAKNAFKNDMPKIRSLAVPGDFKKIKMTFHDEELAKFFKDAEEELAKNPVCEECGQQIPEMYFHDAIAHIIFKAKFPSVRAHPKNRLFLGAVCGCHDKTHRLDTFIKMKVWRKACLNFKEFEPFITEKHKYLNSFRELVNQTLK